MYVFLSIKKIHLKMIENKIYGLYIKVILYEPKCCYA